MNELLRERERERGGEREGGREREEVGACEKEKLIKRTEEYTCVS